MKKLILALGLIFAGHQFNAQEKPAVDSTFLKNWMHSDFEATGFYGVNTLKAKEFLKQNNRKPVDIVVGVLDSGVEYFHEDLKNNIWTNPKEKESNQKDDDKNGFVDDIHGWNFVTDKNGNSYDDDSYELTRQYAKLEKLFREQGHHIKNQKLYNEYLRLKKDYYTSIYRFEQVKHLAQSRLDFYQPRLKALAEALGEQPLSKSVVDNFSSENNLALEGLFIFKEVPQKDWEGKTISNVISSYLKRYESQLDYAEKQLTKSYGLDFNPKAGVMGNHYGNNDVKGLSDDHGTHVAGIIAAEWDNGKGMHGTGGGNYVKIMGVRVVPDGDERDEDIANGIRYAVDNGAKILNMSFGKSYDDNHKLVVDAFKYAEKKNVLIVKAAGNSNEDIDVRIHYPMTLINDKQFSPTTITVGASTRHADKLKARFSNYGKKSVDVFAPGMEIYSSVPGLSKYAFFNGTSMASPAVAGVAALVWSHYPKLSAAEIKTILVSSVNKNDQLKDLSVYGGVVDAYKAVQKAEELYKKKKLK